MNNNFSRWMKRVRETHDEEIDCSACLDAISEYVDLELTTHRAAERMPQVKHHLDQCSVCFEEYQVLRDLARLEANEDLPANDDLSSRLKGHKKA